MSRFGTDNAKAWEAASERERKHALARARWILGNTTHYLTGRPYEQEDIERLAAELIRFKAEPPII